MKIFKIILLAGSFCVWSTAFADAAAEKEAEKLLNIMNMEKLLEQAMSQMIDVQLQQNAALAPYKGVMIEFFKKHMSYDSLKPEILIMYSDVFSASELKEINAFYTTKVGKKTIEKMPTLMAQGGQIGAGRVQANIAELRSMIKAEGERLEKLNQQ